MEGREPAGDAGVRGAADCDSLTASQHAVQIASSAVCSGGHELESQHRLGVLPCISCAVARPALLGTTRCQAVGAPAVKDSGASRVSRVRPGRGNEGSEKACKESSWQPLGLSTCISMHAARCVMHLRKRGGCQNTGAGADNQPASTP